MLLVAQARAHSAFAAGFPWKPPRRILITCLNRTPAPRRRLAYMQPNHTQALAKKRQRRPGPLRKFQSALGAPGWETGGEPATWEEEAPLPARRPHPRPLMALSRRFRSCAGAVRGHRFRQNPSILVRCALYTYIKCFVQPCLRGS